MGRIFLRGGTVATGKPDAIESGIVEIVDGGIGRVGPAADFSAPPDAG